jgi:hypothetical protein
MDKESELDKVELKHRENDIERVKKMRRNIRCDCGSIVVCDLSEGTHRCFDCKRFIR